MEAPPRSKRQPVRRQAAAEAVATPNADSQNTTTIQPQSPAQLTTSPSQTPPPHESRSQSPQVAESRSTSPPEPLTRNTRSSRSRSPSQLPTTKGKAPQRKPAAKKGKGKAASRPRAASSGPSTRQGVGTSSPRGEKRVRSESNDEDAEDAGDERATKRARKETPTTFGFSTPGKVRRFEPKRRIPKSSPARNDNPVAVPLTTLTNNEKAITEQAAPSHDVDALSTIPSIEETTDRSRHASNPPKSTRRERSVSPEDSGDFEEYGVNSIRRRRLQEERRTIVDLEKKNDLLAAVRLTDLTKKVKDKAMRNEDSSVEKKAIADILVSELKPIWSLLQTLTIIQAKGGIIPSGFSPSRTSSITARVIFPATATRKELKLIDPNIIEMTYKMAKILTELPASHIPSPDVAAMGFQAIVARLARDEREQFEAVQSQLPLPQSPSQQPPNLSQSPSQQSSIPKARHRESKAPPKQKSPALPQQTSEGDHARDSEGATMSESESEVQKVAEPHEPQTPIQAPIQTPMRAPESQGWRTIATLAKSLVSAPFNFLAGRSGAGDEAATTNRLETDFTFNHPHNLPPPPTTPSRPSKQSKTRAQSERRPTSKSQLKGARGSPEKQVPKTERRRRLDSNKPLHLRQDISSSRRSEFQQQQDEEKQRQREEQAAQIQQEDNGHAKNTYSLPSPESSGDDELVAPAGLVSKTHITSLLDTPHIDLNNADTTFAPAPPLVKPTNFGKPSWGRMPAALPCTNPIDEWNANPNRDPLAVAAVDAFARSLGLPGHSVPGVGVQVEANRGDPSTSQNTDNPFARLTSQSVLEDPNEDLSRARRPTSDIGRQVDSVTANIEEGKPPLAQRRPVMFGGMPVKTSKPNGYPSWSRHNPLYRGLPDAVFKDIGRGRISIDYDKLEELQNQNITSQTETEGGYNPNPSNTYTVPTSPTGSDSSEDGNEENVGQVQDSGVGNITRPTQDSSSVLQQKQWSQTPPPKTPRPGNAELPQQSAADLLKAKAQQHQPKISSKLREVMVMSSPPVNVNVQMDIENWEGIFDPRVIKAVDNVPISYARPERHRLHAYISDEVDEVETAVSRVF
jgi:hypothetical protein